MIVARWYFSSIPPLLLKQPPYKLLKLRGCVDYPTLEHFEPYFLPYRLVDRQRVQDPIFKNFEYESLMSGFWMV